MCFSPQCFDTNYFNWNTQGVKCWQEVVHIVLLNKYDFLKANENKTVKLNNHQHYYPSVFDRSRWSLLSFCCTASAIVEGIWWIVSIAITSLHIPHQMCVVVFLHQGYYISLQYISAFRRQCVIMLLVLWNKNIVSLFLKCVEEHNEHWLLVGE